MKTQHTQTQKEFISKARKLANSVYEQGGYLIVETFTDKDILDRFYPNDLDAVIYFCEHAHNVEMEAERESYMSLAERESLYY